MPRRLRIVIDAATLRDEVEAMAQIEQDVLTGRPGPFRGMGPAFRYLVVVEETAERKGRFLSVQELTEED